MLDHLDLALLQRLAIIDDEPTDGATLANELGMPGDETTHHLWHLQGEGCAAMHLAGTWLTWTITDTGRASLPAET